MENTTEEHKIVLITGAAKGIGKAVALELAENGYDIVINYLSSNKEAEKLRDSILDTYGVRCIALQADVSDEKQVDEMVSQIERTLGSVDVLINNAAIDLSNLFHLKNADEFRRTLDVNVVGAYNLAKRVYPEMLKKEYGRIVNISSTNGINTYYPMCFDYDASKAALISLTHNLAVQFGPYVHVNAVAPGFIGTESELDGYDEEFLKQETEKILVKRYGEPEEVAHLVHFLISDKADYINNTVIRIDGGQMGSN
ncbi:MAG: SDR family oxidoreductase [Faecalicoccus sp.]|nr:SDR family oxidoreductase [Faecalicoccus sp.]